MGSAGQEITGLVVAGLGVFVAAVFDVLAVSARNDRRRPRSQGVVSLMPARPAGVSLHETPKRPLTICQAHSTMQQHCGCRRSQCRQKDAAYMTLVDVGHIKPAWRSDWS